MASYETYSPQDTASTTAVVEVAVAICLNSLLFLDENKTNDDGDTKETGKN